MLELIEQWIDATLESHSDNKVSCEELLLHFNGFYPQKSLKNSFYVVVDELPKPNFPELRQAGLGAFIDKEMEGITYKNTYFIKKGYDTDLVLHFHELVHVQQWQHLGAQGFISRYIQEFNEYGYDEMPLEKMAYSLESYFKKKKKPFDIKDYVQRKI